MTEPNFVQLLRTKKAEYLISEYPLAFALLSYIAMHARRYNGHPDGLLIGEALVGYTCLPGMTRQNYRTAIKRLENENLIKIVSNGRDVWTREKSTINVTINCNLVSLCNTDVYDINSDDGNHQVNHQVTIDQPSTNHKQERTTKNNNVKEQQTPTPLSPLPVFVPVVGCSFSCLDGFVLSDEDVKTLCSFPEVDVIRAVQVRKEYKKKVDSEMGFLLSAIEKKYQPKNVPKIHLSEKAKSNRDKLFGYATAAEAQLKIKDIKIIDFTDHAMFGTVKLPYEHENFKELVKEARIKFNLWQAAPPPKLAEVLEEGKIMHMQHAGNIGNNLLHQIAGKN